MCGINRAVPAETDRNAEKVRQRKKTVIWLNQINQISQTNQTDQINQMNLQGLTGWSSPTN